LDVKKKKNYVHMSPSLKVGPPWLFVSGEVEQRAIVLIGNIF